MISLLHNIVNELDYLPKDGADYTPETKGKNVFQVFYNTKITEFNGELFGGIRGVCGLIQKYDDVRMYIHITEISIFDSYFRNLYRIFKYIDETALIEDSERYNYSCIVRAQLSDFELLMLFYNALTIKDDGKFKQLIEKYAIFNNIRTEMLARENKDYKLYDGRAYIH